MTASLAESKYRTNYKTSLVICAIGCLASMSLLTYFVAWLKLSFVYMFFVNAQNPLQLLVGFFKFYLFSLETLGFPFYLSIGIITLGAVGMLLSLYRYLRDENKPMGSLILMFPLWFLFIALPILSYVPLLICFVVIYHYAILKEPRKIQTK